MATTPSSGLLLDAGVLLDQPVLELYDWTAVQKHGGLSVLPRRDRWLEAMGAGIEAVGLPERVGETFPQAVVHLQKGRAATEQGLAAAWDHLEVGGRLVLVGGNGLGIKSAVKRLGLDLEQEGVVVANRARARAVAFERTPDRKLKEPEAPLVEVENTVQPFALRGAVGVFSAGRVDRGTQLLLKCLENYPPAGRILDMGCGLGILGLAALKWWPSAAATLADVDRRAVEAAQLNAHDLGVADRCHTVWWDARLEGPPVTGCDLVLINPPFHTTKAVDLDPARAMFAGLDRALKPGGSALIVANRTLPYEADLGRVGRVRQVLQTEGFKILEMQRG
jgi:16S rRNA (guanine1207-N2)-methyltransferase